MTEKYAGFGIIIKPLCSLAFLYATTIAYGQVNKMNANLTNSIAYQNIPRRLPLDLP